jgi:hypothetical protein
VGQVPGHGDCVDADLGENPESVIEPLAEPSKSKRLCQDASGRPPEHQWMSLSTPNRGVHASTDEGKAADLGPLAERFDVRFEPLIVA